MNGQERPTALIRRVDLSADGQRASGAPASSEAVLVAGYGGLIGSLVAKPCVCGGDVTADPLRPAPGVAAHNHTGRHKAWRQNHEAWLYD